MNDPMHTFADGFGNWHAKTDSRESAIGEIAQALVERGDDYNDVVPILEEHVQKCLLHEGYYCENDNHTV